MAAQPVSGSVLAGVDGSDASMDALRFAAVEARLRGRPLRVVHAWTAPTVGFPPIDDVKEMDAHERRARMLVDHALTAVGGDLEGLTVDRVVVPGVPAWVLVDQASAEDLLVVGSRGRGGFVGLLLGSVSQQVVVHAPCPVVVVRVPDER